jgi:nucleoside-diphosphate-sugar epimerase
VGKLEKHSILLTGGTGFAGRYAIKRLVNDGNTVYALVREKTKLLATLNNFSTNPLLKVIEVPSPEKLSLEELKAIIETNDITTVIHIAGIVGERGYSWDRYFEVNVTWTKNLALAFLAANGVRNKFIFTSSVGVYGTIPQQVPASEKTPYNADGKYHRSKVLAELELLGLHKNSKLPLIILRPTIMYGNEDTGFLFKLFKLMSKKRFPLCSSNPEIHLLDVELLADVYSKFVAVSTPLNGIIYNVADYYPVEIKALCKYISDSMSAKSLKIPSFVFSLLVKLSAFKPQYAVSIKLISKTWKYDVSELYGTFDLNKTGTIELIDKKYFEWYRERLDNNG